MSRGLVSRRLSEVSSRLVGTRSRASVADHQAGRSLVRRAPSVRCAWRRPEPRHRRYQPASSPCRRSALRGLVRQVECPDAPSSMPSGRHEWRVLPSPHCLRRRRRAAPARRRLWPRCLRLPAQSDRGESFDTSLAQDAVAQPPGVLLRVNGHPDFLARRGMRQQEMTAFPGPDLDKPRYLQLADDLGPRHVQDRKPIARLCQCASPNMFRQWVGSRWHRCLPRSASRSSRSRRS